MGPKPGPLGPDLRARPAQLGSKVNSAQGSDFYRMNDLIKTARGSHQNGSSQGRDFSAQQAAVFKYQSGLRQGTLTLAGRSDATYGDQTKDGRWRVGCLINVLPSSLRGPCYIHQWLSNLTRITVKSSIGGDLHASSKMMDQMALLWEFYTPFADIMPGVVVL